MFELNREQRTSNFDKYSTCYCIAKLLIAIESQYT